jgi:hypothetical protein
MPTKKPKRRKRPRRVKRRKRVKRKKMRRTTTKTKMRMRMTRKRLLTPRRLLKPVRRHISTVTRPVRFAVGAEAACAGAHELAMFGFGVLRRLKLWGW